METTFDYLRLCSAPHKRRYVVMSVMLRSLIKCPKPGSNTAVVTT
jgi:hypothetical protein